MEKKLRERYFTPNEVRQHNIAEDIWVSYHGHVHDLTPLIKDNSTDPLIRPIVANAGYDISHWFDLKTQEVRNHVDPVMQCVMPYTPSARFLHVPPPCPRTDWRTGFDRPWWRDEKYHIGTLSEKTRLINVMNMLTSQEKVIEVCSEETIYEILERYKKYNAHAASYQWKYEGVNLEMDETLEENGIRDDDYDFDRLKMRDDVFLPAIQLYFNDDLTEL